MCFPGSELLLVALGVCHVDADKFSGHLIECRVTTSVCVTVIICREELIFLRMLYLHTAWNAHSFHMRSQELPR